MVDLSFLADDPYPAIVLVVGGMLAAFIAVYGKRDDTHLDELATYVGFILGAVIGLMAVLVAIEETVNWFTLVMMIVLAVTLFLKPMKDIPWAALAGVIAGGIATFVASVLLGNMLSGNDRLIVLLIVFGVVAFVVHLLFHFIEDLLKLTRMILDWRPVMVVVGLVAAIEGVLLFFDSSLHSLF